MTSRLRRRAVTLLLCLCLSFSAAAERSYYLGTVGDRPVQLDLSFSDSSVSSPGVSRPGVSNLTVRGRYYYDAVGVPLDLEGAVTPAGEVRLNEYTQAVTTLGRQQTGVFEGALSVGAAGGDTFSGTWHSPNGDTLPFNLTRVAQYADIVFDQGRITAKASYPVFSSPFSTPDTRLQSDLINSLFDFVQEGQEAAAAGELFSGWNLAREQTVTYASRNLVSVAETLSVYTGGAHPNTGLAAYTLFTDGDRVRSVTLQDFFLPEVDYLALLSPYIANALLEQGAQWVVDGSVDGFTGDELSVVTVSPTGLQFGFEPYAVGPYAQGTFFVTVPFGVLEPVIDPAGPLRAFVE